MNAGLRGAGREHRLQAAAEPLIQWLVRCAARCAPPILTERLEEEWRADLSVRSTVASRLRFALGCCWATRAIALEHLPASIPAGAAAVGPKLLPGDLRVIGDLRVLGDPRYEPGIFAGRSATFFLIAGLHIALFYGLMTGLAFRIINVLPSALPARILQAPQTHSVAPPALVEDRGAAASPMGARIN